MNAGKVGAKGVLNMKADNDDNPRPKNLAENKDANSPLTSAGLDAGSGIGKATSNIGKGVKSSFGGPKKNSLM